MSKEATYELIDGFEYTNGKEVVTAQFITLTAPSKKNMEHFVPIKQAVTAAIHEISEKSTSATVEEKEDSGEDEQSFSGDQIMGAMYAWSGNLYKVFLHAEQLFKNNTALVDGETKLIPALQDKMSTEDSEGLLGEYIANFIVPSLINGQTKSTD